MSHTYSLTNFWIYEFRLAWANIGEMYQLFAVREDLYRLIQWASKKHLIGPRRLYQNRLVDVEIRLSRHQLRSPTLMVWVKVIYTLVWVFTPPRRYYQKGSAGRYKKLSMVG